MTDERFDVLAELYMIADEQGPPETPSGPLEQDERLELLVTDLFEVVALSTGNGTRDARLERFRELIQREFLSRQHERRLGNRP